MWRLIVNEWIEESTKSELSQKTFSYEDFSEQVHKSPMPHIRTASTYILDMLNHFTEESSKHIGRKLFENDHHDAPAVYGQRRTKKEIYNILKSFQEEGINNKFILLVGPNGSAKSSFVKKLMKGMELYSEREEGSIYSFSWIFPIEAYTKGSLGLNQQSINPTNGHLSTYAYLDDKEISAILPSDLKDNPILLIPIKHRRKIIDDLLSDNQEYLKLIKKSYLYNGDMSKRNKMVYDALLKNYKGDHADVLKHIRVEKINISKRYSQGAVTIEPQLHVDAQMQQITMDKRLASLPPSLQSLNLFQMQGQLTMSNRGVLEFSDLLKRPLDTYKYLLQTMETGNINLNGILTELDIFFIGTSNEIHLNAFKQHPDFNSFKGRFKFIKAPYLLDYKEEEKIYSTQVNSLALKANFEPHAVTALCLFSVMTRLRSPLSKNYEDKNLANIVSKFSPLQKTFFLSDIDQVPEEVSSEQKQIIQQSFHVVYNEFTNENLYEGKFGLSPREVKSFIYEISNEKEVITFLDILIVIQALIKRKSDFDFLNMTPQGDFHNPVRFIEHIKTYCIEKFDKELRDCLGLIDNRSYDDYIKKYISSINAQIKGEKVKNEITGKFVEPDEYFMKEFEKNIAIKEDSQKFRSHLISKLGAYYLDNPGLEIDYKKVFPELIKSLKESFRNEQKKHIQTLSNHILFYEKYITNEQQESSKEASTNSKEVESIEQVINTLAQSYNYSKKGAFELLKYVLSAKY